MLILKFLLVLSCYSVYGSESSEELETLLSNRTMAAFLKKVVVNVYNEQKLKTISTVEEALQDVIDNVTLVGSQNIYGNNGEILEIRTVELHLPRIPKGDLVKFDETEDGDEDVNMSEVRHLFNRISALGFELIVEAKEYSKDGETVTHTYMENDLYCHYFDEQQLVNKTIEVESLEVVEKAIADLKKNHERVSVHKFNDKLEFVPEGSNIVPEHVATITDDEGEPHQEIIDEILKGAATSFIKSNESLRDVVPSKLVEYLRSRFNDTDFYVFSGEPYAWYLRQDNFFRVAVEYFLASWDSDDSIIFTVFGSKTK